ncbi:hypothetical protein F5883DRAFT_697744 [Diaporthe sp. PMI_573]|nr:hypothetical protein F5883DRAFT_697744 [Diaporthaceae sp. PMI_573]
MTSESSTTSMADRTPKNDLIGEAEAWHAVIKKARKSVARLKICHTHHFDVLSPLSGDGTGFYVDEENGYLLTVRHNVGPGPFSGVVIFEGDIELEVLRVVYSDPEHDYAIVQLDAELARSYGISAIPLDAEEAKPGVAIRLLGYHDGRGLSIGQGFINNTDAQMSYTNCPTDLRTLNTEHIQAAFSALGGSSGSPALDIRGHAVGLLVARSETAINTFVPLHYPQRVLKLLAAGKTVLRGTIQVGWSLLPLHECKRYHLPATWDEKIRRRDRTNAIVAGVVLEGGPADGKLKAGDILLEADQKLQTDLWKLSTHMDECIDQEVRFRVWRHDHEITVVCRVGDLHVIVANHIMVRFGAVFHQIDWLSAAERGAPVGSIYVTGRALSEVFKPHQLLESINGLPITGMDSLSTALDSLGRGGCRVSTVHRSPIDSGDKTHTAAYLPTDLFQPVGLRRQPLQGGGWSIEENGHNLSRIKAPIETALPKKGFCQKGDRIFRSIVPLKIYRSVGVHDCDTGEFSEAGVLLKHGLVIMSRNDSTWFDEIILTLAGIEVPAHIIFMHEAVNFVFITYDTTAVPKGIDLEPACLSRESLLKEHDHVFFASFDSTKKKRVVKTSVELLGDRTAEAGGADYRAFHHETILLNSSFSNMSSGVVLFQDGTVAGLQFYHKDGIHDFLPASRVTDALEHWEAGRLSDLRFQDFDVTTMSLSDALRKKLPDETVSAVLGHSSEKTQVLVVDKVRSHCATLNGESEAHPLRKDDIILSLNNKVVVQSSDLRYIFTDDCISVRVLRDGEVAEFSVPTVPIDQVQSRELIHFCGAFIHRPSLQAQFNQGNCRSKIFISSVSTGSPAHLYGIEPGMFIESVAGRDVATLEEFQSAIQATDETGFTMSVLLPNGTKILSLRKMEDHFPSVLYTRDVFKGVKRTALGGGGAVDDGTYEE